MDIVQNSHGLKLPEGDWSNKFLSMEVSLPLIRDQVKIDNPFCWWETTIQHMLAYDDADDDDFCYDSQNKIQNLIAFKFIQAIQTIFSSSFDEINSKQKIESGLCKNKV